MSLTNIKTDKTGDSESTAIAESLANLPAKPRFNSPRYGLKKAGFARAPRLGKLAIRRLFSRLVSAKKTTLNKTQLNGPFYGRFCLACLRCREKVVVWFVGHLRALMATYRPF